jgi:hypothetical protein
MSLADTEMLRRPQAPRNPADSTAGDVFDAERDGDVQTIVNQSDELTESSTSDDTDAESLQGLSNSEFEDLDHVLSRATSIANSRPEEEATDQSTKALQASMADDTGVQSAQEPSTPIVPDSDEDLDAIDEFLNLPSNKELPDVAEVYEIQDLGSEPKRRDLAQNRDIGDAIDVMLDSVVPPTRPDLEHTSFDSSGTQLTSAENQYLSKDQLPNHKKNAGNGLSSHREHSPSRQTSDPLHKRTLSGPVSTIGPHDESDTAFSIAHSPVELYRVPTNSPTGDGRVRSSASCETSVHSGNTGLDDLTVTDPPSTISTELQPGTFGESKKSDLSDVSLKITDREGELCIMLRKRLYANSSRLSDRDLRWRLRRTIVKEYREKGRKTTTQTPPVR